jgi:cytoskeletal protein CcmA (bactofilin family)
LDLYREQAREGRERMSMWNKRQSEEPTPPLRPSPPVAGPQLDVKDVKKENILPVSSMPFKTATPESDAKGSGQASIGKAVKINGQIFSKEDLYIDGDVEGTVELHENRLTIGPNGRVQASVRAREVVVLGSIQGNVEASDRIDIRKEAKLVGDIKTARIVIEDGAYFKGSIDIVRQEAQKTAAPAGATTAVHPAAAAPKPAAAGAAVGSTPSVPVEVKR